jgi:hypothetical protein
MELILTAASCHDCVERTLDVMRKRPALLADMEQAGASLMLATSVMRAHELLELDWSASLLDRFCEDYVENDRALRDALLAGCI